MFDAMQNIPSLTFLIDAYPWLLALFIIVVTAYSIMGILLLIFFLIMNQWVNWPNLEKRLVFPYVRKSFLVRHKVGKKPSYHTVKYLLNADRRGLLNDDEVNSL